VRVIAGKVKGRKLVTVPGAGTRPVSDKVKGAVFDILASEVVGTRFLDLFGGTGSVGIEALSRGAEYVVFIERARKAVTTIERNLEITGFSDRATVLHEDAFHYLGHADELFDIIYVAPPQYQELWAKALLALDARNLLTPMGQVIVQIHPKEAQNLPLRELVAFRERQYGSTLVRFYAPKDSVQEG
jgi:16S rRNA (guanine966-N2)-methyltransferase